MNAIIDFWCVFLFGTAIALSVVHCALLIYLIVLKCKRR